MTKKQTLILRLNELRASNNLPPYEPAKVTMTVEEIEGLIYHLETPSHSHKPAPAIMIPALLLKLNTLRARAKEKPLKEWKKGRDDLTRAIKDMERELVEEAMLSAKKGRTKIAVGADTKKSHTDMHVNPIREDMKKMRKREERQRIAAAKDTARKIALWAGYSAANVLAYLLAKNQTLPTLAGEALKADIKAWLALRSEVLPQRRGKPAGPQRALAARLASAQNVPVAVLLRWLKLNNVDTDIKLPRGWFQAFRKWHKEKPVVKTRTLRDSGSLGPQAIADALGHGDAKKVRVMLRKLEPKIPQAWHVAEERWGFKQEHKSDILKLLGAKP